MALWGSVDNANNAPKYAIKAGSTDTGSDLFGTEVVGLDDGEVKNSTRANHTGWTKVTYGTGPVTSITVTDGGEDYTNGEVVEVTGGETPALATVVTNANGTITAVNLTNAGSGFSDADDVVFSVNEEAGGDASEGTDAEFTVVLGGRAGRIQTETLVALSGMTSNGSTLAG